MENLLIYNDFLAADLNVLAAKIAKNEVDITVVKTLLAKCDELNLNGNLWQSLLTIELMKNENVFSLALERKHDISPELKATTLADIKSIFEAFNYEFDDSLPGVALVKNYRKSRPVVNIEIDEIFVNLQKALGDAKDHLEFYKIIHDHYLTYGVGMYGLNKAFRYNQDHIESIKYVGNFDLDEIVGMDLQKGQLISNTKAFLEGQMANNVLLYGDAGTGKSSCIKGLLNRYYKDGLRIVEVYKHQFIHLPEIIQELQSRNFKFILFMDDLSFEEFEIEYKYLKAVIEGGLEKKPENVIIYATSNRRHLVKETWSEREGDEVSVNDALQEKTSLASRFGVTIYFGRPNKKEFFNIIDGLYLQYQCTMDKEKVYQEAIKWEMRHGGFSGRTARQFMMNLISLQQGDSNE